MIQSPVEMRVRAALFAFVLAAGCGGEDGPRKPVPAGYEGAVELSRFTQYYPGQPTGTFLHAQAEFFHDPEARWLDAGSSVRLGGPAGEVKLVRTELPGRVVYQKPSGTILDPALFVTEASYSLDVAGSHVDYGVPGFELAIGLTTPRTLELTSPDLAATPEVVLAAGTGAALTLAWTPGDGEYVDVIFAVGTSAGTGEYLAYRVLDDGDFEVPSFGLANLPPGEGSLTVARKITTPLRFPQDGSGTGLGADAVQCRLVRQ